MGARQALSCFAAGTVSSTAVSSRWAADNPGNLLSAKKLNNSLTNPSSSCVMAPQLTQSIKAFRYRWLAALL